jgi:hypothetical protein
VPYEIVQMIIDGKESNHLLALDGTGYQFLQARGLIIIDSPLKVFYEIFLGALFRKSSIN